MDLEQSWEAFKQLKHYIPVLPGPDCLPSFYLLNKTNQSNPLRKSTHIQFVYQRFISINLPLTLQCCAAVRAAPNIGKPHPMCKSFLSINLPLTLQCCAAVRTAPNIGKPHPMCKSFISTIWPNLQTNQIQYQIQSFISIPLPCCKRKIILSTFKSL